MTVNGVPALLLRQPDTDQRPDSIRTYRGNKQRGHQPDAAGERADHRRDSGILAGFVHGGLGRAAVLNPLTAAPTLLHREHRQGVKSLFSSRDLIGQSLGGADGTAAGLSRVAGTVSAIEPIGPSGFRPGLDMRGYIR